MPSLLRRLSPIQILVLGFAVIVLSGAVLLTMPFSSARNRPQPFVDCLFMASSAISTTGLVVADIGRDYSLIGQLIMLFIIQVGGIGYMCFIPLVVIGLGGRLGIGTRMLLRESMLRPSWLDMIKFSRVIVLATAGIELVAAGALTLLWLRDFPLRTAIYAAVFHSINAFCTAGMSIWSTSMAAWRTSPLLHAILIPTMLAGGIGFFVIYDLWHFARKALRREHPRSLSTHSRLALSVTGIAVAAGAAGVFVAGLTQRGIRPGERLLTALFQAVSASTTTGFNTVAVGELAPAAFFIIILLMFIGASPNSTGGGIKTTTLGVMLADLVATLRGRPDATLFHRRIAADSVRAAFGLTLAAGIWVAAVLVALLLLEKTTLTQSLFEVVSAFGNVGLSTGITSNLSATSRVLLSLTMFFGRVGPLAIGLSLLRRHEQAAHHYPEGDFFVG